MKANIPSHKLLIVIIFLDREIIVKVLIMYSKNQLELGLTTHFSQGGGKKLLKCKAINYLGTGITLYADSI